MTTLRLLACFFWLITLGACSTDNNTPTPASGPLSGTVQLWDDKTAMLADNSSVLVAVDDIPGTTTLTDGSGRYSFPSLSYGLHDVTFSKTGYGTYKIFGVLNASNANGIVIPAVQLGKLATTSITSLSVSGSSYSNSPGVSVLYSVSPTPTANNRGFVRYFISGDPNVSNTNYRYASPVVSVLNNNTTGGFTREDLLTAGFASGQTVYLRLYGESLQSNVYTDPNVGKQTFPNINMTTVPAVSFVIP